MEINLIWFDLIVCQKDGFISCVGDFYWAFTSVMVWYFSHSQNNLQSIWMFLFPHSISGRNFVHLFTFDNPMESVFPWDCVRMRVAFYFFSSLCFLPLLPPPPPTLYIISPADVNPWPDLEIPRWNPHFTISYWIWHIVSLICFKVVKCYMF